MMKKWFVLLFATSLAGIACRKVDREWAPNSPAEPAEGRTRGMDTQIAHATKASAWASHQDWMSHLSWRTLVEDLLIPGTHDSCAYDDRGWVGWGAQTQDSDIITQLNRGIRFFDMRVGACQDTHGTELCMYHGNVYLHSNLWSPARQMVDFLLAHPHETIIWRLKFDHSNDHGPDYVANWRSVVEDSVINHMPTNFYKNNVGTLASDPGYLPNGLQLGDARGKIVIFWDGSDLRTVYGYDYAHVTTRESLGYPYEFADWRAEEASAIFNKIFYSSSNYAWLENPSSFINWGPPMPHRCAENMNPRVIGQLERVITTDGGRNVKGIISMDFPYDYMIELIIKSSYARQQAKGNYIP